MQNLWPSGFSRRPAAVAVRDDERSLTFDALSAHAIAIASGLERRWGLGPDDHVALLMGNRSEYLEIVLGALLSGLWITPINWHLEDEEIRYVLEDSGARLVFVDAAHRPRIEGMGVPTIDVDGERYGALLSEAGEVDPEGPPGGTMVYTSGTSGRPKGVMRARRPTIREMLESCVAGGRRFGLDGGGKHLVTGPMYHAAPLLFCLYDLLAGAEARIERRFDAGDLLRTIDEEGIAHVHLVPTMFVRLLRLPASTRERFEGSSLRLVLHGAAPVAEGVKRAMIEWWGPILKEYWGATEGGIYTLVDSDSWLERPGTVGQPIEAFEVFAVDERGERLPPDEEGLLYCRHRSFSRPFVYHRHEHETREAYLGEGTFTVGDLGRVDADGYVYLGERRSNLILSGGVNVYPAEVERALRAHSLVADVAVFGVPDAEWGEVVAAAVELEEGATADSALERELERHLRGRIAGFKVPRRIYFLEAIPRLPSGKLYRRRLREELTSGGGNGARGR